MFTSSKNFISFLLSIFEEKYLPLLKIMNIKMHVPKLYKESPQKIRTFNHLHDFHKKLIVFYACYILIFYETQRLLSVSPQKCISMACVNYRR